MDLENFLRNTYEWKELLYAILLDISPSKIDPAIKAVHKIRR